VQLDTSTTTAGFATGRSALGNTDPRQIVSTDTIYRQITSCEPCWITTTDGAQHDLPIERWLGGDATTGEDRAVDEALLGLCAGPTVDLGCGPGRFTAALSDRGIVALGIDVSAAAVEMTVQRGGRAVHGDVFVTPAANGAWAHVLLADGNIGIGGNPQRMLKRARHLLHPRGTVVAEVDAHGTGVHHERRRWETRHTVTTWFSWSRVGGEAVHSLAEAAGLVVASAGELAGRHLVTMRMA
jgi:SAM-dependent methyltransferase